MTTLYRSPTVLIADHEWHLCVVKLGGRIYRQYKWRPASARPQPWRPADKWTGRPFKLWRDFKGYIPHAKAAEAYEKNRLAALTEADKRDNPMPQPANREFVLAASASHGAIDSRSYLDRPFT